jgi:hypothetical protein
MEKKWREEIKLPSLHLPLEGACMFMPGWHASRQVFGLAGYLLT